MREKICPLGLMTRGAYSCQGKNCAWTDKNDECLIKEILSELKDCLQANKPKELNPADFFVEFLANYPSQKKGELK